MNDIVTATEENLDIGVPAKIMLNAQIIEQLSRSIPTQQTNVVSDIKVREAIPCGTTRTIRTNQFDVEATEVDAPLDGQTAEQAKKEAERKANEEADTLIKAMEDNYICTNKECRLNFSFKKEQIGETQFWEQDAIVGTSVRHKAVIKVQGVVTLRCAQRRILV